MATDSQSTISTSNPLTSLDDYIFLGKSGLKVSPVCLGTMTFGNEWDVGVNLEESKKVYDLYRSKGGNFFDTANCYTNGQSEQFLGQFVGQFRSDAVIATKYTAHPKFSPSSRKPGEQLFPNGGGNSRKSMVENLDASLKRLGTGYVDLFYVHNWEGDTPFDEVMRGLDDVVRSGKALYVGVSDVPSWALARANTISELRGWSQFITLQTRYNLCDRSFEVELGPAVQEFGMSVCAWGALAEGFLTGKHSKDQKMEGSGRNDSVSKHFASEKSEKILEEVKTIAKETGRTPGQVSLNWILQRPHIIPIIGAKTVNQLEENLASLDFTLSSEQMKRLNEVSNPDLPFPHSFLSRKNFFDNAGLKVKGKKNPWLNI